MKSNKTQQECIIEYLRRGKQITPTKARTLFQVERLADVVYKLKKQGYSIQAKRAVDENGKQYGVYWMTQNKKP